MGRKTFEPSTDLPKLVDEGVQEEVRSDPVATMTLEEATNVLLEAMIPSNKDYFVELADLTLKIPRWQLLLGSVLAQFQEGNLASPYIDPSWVGVQLQSTSKKCEECGCDFTPKKLGQRFHDNACGIKYNQKMLAEAKAKAAA